MHADSRSSGLSCAGKLKWTIEGIDHPLIGEEGDIVYAPPSTFHMPEFYGDGPACRLTRAPILGRIIFTTRRSEGKKQALKTIQYTVRGIPARVDQELRSMARMQGSA